MAGSRCASSPAFPASDAIVTLGDQIRELLQQVLVRKANSPDRIRRTLTSARPRRRRVQSDRPCSRLSRWAANRIDDLRTRATDVPRARCPRTRPCYASLAVPSVDITRRLIKMAGRVSAIAREVAAASDRSCEKRLPAFLARLPRGSTFQQRRPVEECVLSGKPAECRLRAADGGVRGCLRRALHLLGLPASAVQLTRPTRLETKMAGGRRRPQMLTRTRPC